MEVGYDLGKAMTRRGHVITQKPIISGMKVLDSELTNSYRNVKEAIHIKL